MFNKELQFSKTQANLEKKIREIIEDKLNPQMVRDSFSAWLQWFIFLKKEIKDAIFFKDLDENNNLFYRAYVVPGQEFYAIQIWEKHADKPLARCIETLYANKFDLQNWTENIVDNRKPA